MFTERVKDNKKVCQKILKLRKQLMFFFLNIVNEMNISLGQERMTETDHIEVLMSSSKYYRKIQKSP